MKKIILVLTALFASMTISFAQDIITTKDGKDVEVKILEVSQNEIRYLKYSNLDGPIFTMPTSGIACVHYSNGEVEVFHTTAGNYTFNTTEEIHEGMKYKELKKIYNTKSYIPQIGDPYSRGWTGVASFFISGLGQCIEGEWGRGLGFFGADFGLGLLALTQVGVTIDYSTNVVSYDFSSYFWPIMIASVGLNIWSIIDAVHVAKVKNMYSQDIQAKRFGLAFDLNVQPYFDFTPTGYSTLQPTTGLSLCLKF